MEKWWSFIAYLRRHQFVENNLILKMGPVDKRKVCVFIFTKAFLSIFFKGMVLRKVFALVAEIVQSQKCHGPLCWRTHVLKCLHSLSGFVCSSTTAAPHWRTTPVLRGSCQQGPERGDSLVLRVTPRGQELQNFLCSHGNYWFFFFFLWLSKCFSRSLFILAHYLMSLCICGFCFGV